MYKIQANASGTRSIEITDCHLETIKKYSLLSGLVNSNGIIDEDILDKLKLTYVVCLSQNRVRTKTYLTYVLMSSIIKT